MGKPGLLRYTNTISQNVTCYFLCKTSVTLCNKEPDTKWKVRDGKNVATHDAIFNGFNFKLWIRHEYIQWIINYVLQLFMQDKITCKTVQLTHTNTHTPTQL